MNPNEGKHVISKCQQSSGVKINIKSELIKADICPGSNVCTLHVWYIELAFSQPKPSAPAGGSNSTGEFTVSVLSSTRLPRLACGCFSPGRKTKSSSWRYPSRSSILQLPSGLRRVKTRTARSDGCEEWKLRPLWYGKEMQACETFPYCSVHSALVICRLVP